MGFLELDKKIPGDGDRGIIIPNNPKKKSPIPGMGISEFRGRKIPNQDPRFFGNFYLGIGIFRGLGFLFS